MARIDRINRNIIENIKRNNMMKISLPTDDIEILVKGDRQFAHDVALAYQSLALRKLKEQESAK